MSDAGLSEEELGGVTPPPEVDADGTPRDTVEENGLDDDDDDDDLFGDGADADANADNEPPV